MKSVVVAAGLTIASCGAVIAADMTMYGKAPAPIPTTYDWTGLYFGGHIGGGSLGGFGGAHVGSLGGAGFGGGIGGGRMGGSPPGGLGGARVGNLGGGQFHGHRLGGGFDDGHHRFRGAFRGGTFGYFPSYDDYSYADYGDYTYDGTCLQYRHVHTTAGWRWRQVRVCN